LSLALRREWSNRSTGCRRTRLSIDSRSSSHSIQDLLLTRRNVLRQRLPVRTHARLARSLPLHLLRSAGTRWSRSNRLLLGSHVAHLRLGHSLSLRILDISIPLHCLLLLHLPAHLRFVSVLRERVGVENRHIEIGCVTIMDVDRLLDIVY
jgi:hypothetical protein